MLSEGIHAMTQGTVFIWSCTDFWNWSPRIVATISAASLESAIFQSVYELKKMRGIKTIKFFLISCLITFTVHYIFELRWLFCYFYSTLPKLFVMIKLPVCLCIENIFYRSITQKSVSYCFDLKWVFKTKQKTLSERNVFVAVTFFCKRHMNVETWFSFIK